ncbi:glycoside hydrolase family 48 protein [Paenibacillus tarimensis]|uniref:glycoside hydrolase family 48 protein n=1 Tax=Paenibacillus tarimensis TaxID=416012 RepID=UPI001F257667|nr:glycoside hydrolase family 48 protein [Paenibacillus tarimensis]MCF2944655.1 cellulose 1,4-beta-cellobiosidase [Paenibacillus tarimensis]
MIASSKRKIIALMLTLTMLLSLLTSAAAGAEQVQSAAALDNVHQERFLQMYEQIKDPASGYFSPEGIPYHAIETLMSEAPDYGHMTTSEAYSYWFWLEALYGYYTGDWTHLEAAWDNMEKFIIPSAKEQPTMSYYNPSSPATSAGEKPQPDMYPSQIDGKYPAGRDPLDAELKAAYGNNDTYLMHWLVDVDNFYGFGNLLNPSHTATYVNTFQRGEQESVWEAVPHPSQDDHSFGKPGEGFMSLFTKETAAPAKQWRYTNATDAEGRAVQVMYWAKEMGYNNPVYLDKAKKMGDYLRYGMFDKYFMKIGSAANGAPAPGSGKDAAHYLMSWYTAWGGGLGDNGTGNWAWRIGASHVHHAYQNVVAAYALSQPEGGLIPKSATAQQDWNTSLKRQLEFYTWLQSSEGAIGGGATNSWDGDYKAYPAGVSRFYDMAYDEDPVYHDPPSNTWFGFQTWPLERVAELYYIMASNGDTSSENFKMAKQVIENWIDWSIDYVFVNEKPVTDANGYYLDANGNRILGGQDPAVATISQPGQFYVPGSQEWKGQPDTWKGYSSFTGNPNFRVVTKDPSQDVGVLGNYIKALTFYAAGTKAENGDYSALGNEAKTTAEELLEVAWGHNDGIGIALPESRADYYRYFTKEVYIPNGWSGTFGQGNVIPGNAGVPSDPAKGGNGVYISYADLRPDIKNDPQWSYLEQLYKNSYNPVTKKWENGTPTFTYHRFWSQVDIATAYAEYDRLIASGDTGSEPTAPAVPVGLRAAAGDGKVELSWNNAAGAAEYVIKRAEASGGPYTVIAEQSGLSFTDTNVTNGTTYYYVVSATNAQGESANSAEVTAVPAAAPEEPEEPIGDLKLQYKAGDTNATDNQFKPHLRIVNTGTKDVPLSELKIRYYYTIDGDQPQTFNCDWATVGCSNLSGNLVKRDEAVEGADYYLEIGFAAGAGSVAAGADTGEMQIRINKNDWSNYSEADDFSYDPTKSAFADWNKAALYHNGKLVWGTEPK